MSHGSPVASTHPTVHAQVGKPKAGGVELEANHPKS